MRKDSLLEDTMHLKDLDAVSDRYGNKEISDHLNIRATNSDAMHIQVKDSN